MRKTAKTHPYLVKACLPKGTPLSKKKDTIRNNRFRTLGEAITEKDCLYKLGATSVVIFNGKEKVS